MATKIMPATELRARIGKVLDELVQTDEPVFVTRHGRAQAVLLSVATYDTLVERAAQAGPGATDPLAQYRALLDRIDFSERGDAKARLQHTREVYEELAKVRRRATLAMMEHE